MFTVRRGLPPAVPAQGAERLLPRPQHGREPEGEAPDEDGVFMTPTRISARAVMTRTEIQHVGGSPV